MKYIFELCIFEIHICLFSFQGVVNVQWMCLPKDLLSLYVFTEPSALTEAYLSGGKSSADTIMSIYATTSQGRKKFVKIGRAHV